MHWTQRTVDTPGGPFLLYEAGEGAHTVLYLHDELSSAPGPVADRLASEHRVLAPVHPGFGAAARPDWVQSVRDVTEHYMDLLATLDLPPNTTVVGGSLGGWIAVELFIRAGTTFGSMVLVNPVGVRVPGHPARDLWFVRDPEALQFADRAAMPEVSEAEQVANAESAARYGWSPRLYDPSLAPRAHRVDCPVQLVWGGADQLLPAQHLTRWRELLPRSEVVEIPEAGHFPGYEQPDRTAEVIGGFLHATTRRGSNR